MQKHFTYHDIETNLGISRTTLWRWCRAGIFPQPIPCGPHLKRWRIEDIKAWEAAQVQEGGRK